MQEIENFNTGSASNPNANNININPSENIKNKKIIKPDELSLRTW